MRLSRPEHYPETFFNAKINHKIGMWLQLWQNII